MWPDFRGMNLCTLSRFCFASGFCFPYIPSSNQFCKGSKPGVSIRMDHAADVPECMQMPEFSKEARGESSSL